ncbi:MULTISPECIES: hypothetical protein [Chromobacterium]|uniref:hypothetical protein n=1 Tax=Chromobacterium TaxID=535 RepID=UPI001594D67C|nr:MULTISPECIES: hypothetical protein [Chromobacterium]
MSISKMFSTPYRRRAADRKPVLSFTLLKGDTARRRIMTGGFVVFRLVDKSGK